MKTGTFFKVIIVCAILVDGVVAVSLPASAPDIVWLTVFFGLAVGFLYCLYELFGPGRLGRRR